MAKKKFALQDGGFGPREIENLMRAIRQVWMRGLSRRLVIKRCTGEDGFLKCEMCKKVTPSIIVDHIDTVGKYENGTINIDRLFCPSSKLRGLCRPCNRERTAKERAKKKRLEKIPDFT